VDFDPALIDELRRVHGVHTLLLYGSRARGDATPESDIDVAGYADVAETTRDARLWHGTPGHRSKRSPRWSTSWSAQRRPMTDARGCCEP